MPSHILIVNDDTVVTMVSVRVLEQHGYRVTTAENGKEALAALAAETPDLMILDIQMPEMDGIEVIAAMKEIVPFLNLRSRCCRTSRRRCPDKPVT